MNILRLLLILFALAPAPAVAAVSVIGGAIVTPQGVRHAWLVIDGGMITAIRDSKPALPGAQVLETSDFVFPGFVDLHNHPLWAVFERFHPLSPPAAAPWKNRYAWRSDARYHAALQDPWWDLMSHGAFCDLDEYAELQALIGGTTSITGLDLVDENAPPPACIKGLARNLDYYSGFYGSQTGHEKLAWVLGVFSDMHWPAAKKLHDALDAGRLNAIVVHTAEGRRDDDEARAEFTMLKSWGLLTPNTAVVHGVGLSAADFAEMAKARAAMVWSPRSNMELYRQMPNLTDAVKAKLAIALAPDWAPTGSTNMLGEITYADALRTGFTQKQLFDMATTTPARIARLDSRIGALAPGHAADLFLLHGTGNAYAALAHAKPQDVTLTMVGGVAMYGAPENLKALGATVEDFPVCGAARAFNGAALAKSFNRLQADLSARMTAHHLKLAPLVYCN